MRFKISIFVFLTALVLIGSSSAQTSLNVNIGSQCGSINARNNGNGGANSCPGANSTVVAQNFVGTSYASVPSGTKTGDIRIRWTVSGSLYPPVIKRIFETVNGQTQLTTLQVGPAGVPTSSGDVYYCFYNPTNYNLQNAKLLTFEYVDPQTNSVLGYCTFDFSVSIPTGVLSSPLLPGDISGTQTVCNTGDPNAFGSVSLASGGTSPYTYSWESSTSTAFTTVTTVSGATGTSLDLNAAPSTTTYYRRKVTDADGNTAYTDYITLTVQSPTVALGSTATAVAVSCNGGSNGSIQLTPTGGTSPYSFSWTGPNSFTATSEDLSGLFAGSYTVAISDANGCRASRTTSVTEPTALTATTSATNTTSGASTGSASVTASGGTTPYSYLWSPSGGTSSNATGLSAGTYTVTVTDAKGCVKTETVIVGTTAAPLQGSVAAKTNVLCFGGNTGSATVSATGGVGPYTYSWSPSGARMPPLLV